MIVAEQIDEIRQVVRSARIDGRTIAVVPTMGALHAGHVSLIDAARQDADFVVATIFVNPTQFGPSEDFEKYPRPLEKDLQACKAAGVDAVFTPTPEIVYPVGCNTVVTVPELSMQWEGASRPTHFQGVTTVVMKLFQIVLPDKAYFGLKDYQQQCLIRKMVVDLNVPVEVHACPTIREADGLALSSRNAYLSPEERQSAAVLNQALQQAAAQVERGEEDLASVKQTMYDLLSSTEHVVVDYAVIADANTLQELERPRSAMVALVAAKVGQTRLIDNWPIRWNGPG